MDYLEPESERGLNLPDDVNIDDGDYQMPEGLKKLYGAQMEAYERTYRNVTNFTKILNSNYKLYALNGPLSKQIGVIREIPDYRHVICIHQTYPVILPNISIILTFHNEHLMTLIRSINTVLIRTPLYLIEEIILIDDYSQNYSKRNLVEKIEEIDKHGKVHLIRNSQREGLIRSRVIGSRLAKGEVLVFLDSHIEVNTDWLQPLVKLIQQENTTIAIPIVDIIDPTDFYFDRSPLMRGEFDWDLSWRWKRLRSNELTDQLSFVTPYNSPVMASNMFAVNREYFQNIGEYDMGMSDGGGENMELSFRVWQCGGAIKIVPCSRIGVVNKRFQTENDPIKGSSKLVKNLLRCGYVWMDNYVENFITYLPLYMRQMDYGNITDRLEIRSKLDCKPFLWYLETIYPYIGMSTSQTSPKI